MGCQQHLLGVRRLVGALARSDSSQHLASEGLYIANLSFLSERGAKLPGPSADKAPSGRALYAFSTFSPQPTLRKAGFQPFAALHPQSRVDLYPNKQISINRSLQHNLTSTRMRVDHVQDAVKQSCRYRPQRGTRRTISSFDFAISSRLCT